MLLLLLEFHKISTIKPFTISGMILNDVSGTFIPWTVLKHYRKGSPLHKSEWKVYTYERLCFIACLREYISRQNNLEELMLIATMKTLTKEISAVDNIVDFSAHRCQRALTSKAKKISVDVNEIMHRQAISGGVQDLCGKMHP